MAAVDEVQGAIVAAELRPYRAVAKGYTSFNEGDVLFAKITPCMENGKAAVARDLSGGLGFGSTEFHVLRPGPKLVRDFLFHWIRQPEFRRQAKAHFTGTAGQQRVPTSFLQDFPFPLPPLAEQRRIVDILDRAANIRRLRRQAQDTARLIVPALFNKMFGDPIANQMGWPSFTFNELGNVQLGRQRAPKYQSGNFTCKYVRVANVFEDLIDTSDVLSMDFDEKDFKNHRLAYGDILLNEGQSIELVGRPAMWRDEIKDCCFQNTLVRFQPCRSRMNSEFALSLIMTYYKRGILRSISSKTSNVAHLGAGRFAKLSAICPPLPLQNEFSALCQQFRNVTARQDAAFLAASQMVDALQSQLLG